MNTSSKTITLTRTQKPFLGRDELLTMYYNDIRAYEPLTENETIELLKPTRMEVQVRRKQPKQNCLITTPNLWYQWHVNIVLLTII